MAPLLVLTLAPRLAWAEVSDKIPTLEELTIYNVIVCVIAFIAPLLVRRVLHVSLLVLLSVPGAALLYELRFSDIANSVTVETSRTYIVLTWTLVLMPVVVTALAYRVASRRSPIADRPTQGIDYSRGSGRRWYE